jgi:SAM-dependent methyltransferase
MAKNPPSSASTTPSKASPSTPPATTASPSATFPKTGRATSPSAPPAPSSSSSPSSSRSVPRAAHDRLRPPRAHRPGLPRLRLPRPRSSRQKSGEFIRTEFAFHRCRACELLFVEPFSGFEIYNDAYYRGAGPDPFVDYETEYRDYRRTDRALEFADLARLAEAHLVASAPSSASAASAPTSPAPLAWLDFGCGAGGFLKFLRERATFAGRPLSLTGHDVGSYAELLRSTDGFRILDFAAITREPSAQFDVISLIEVIEHLPEPAATIALVSRLLKPGGLLLLTTGNLDSPVARRHGIHYRYCAPEIHVSLFNPRCLARLYAAHGLTPLPVRYDGTVVFKVVKSLRHRPVLRAVARLALHFPPFVRLVDHLYGVSAMPCAVKPGRADGPPPSPGRPVLH